MTASARIAGLGRLVLIIIGLFALSAVLTGFRSGSTAVGSPVAKGIRAVEVAAVLALAAAREHDRVGALAFTGQVLTLLGVKLWTGSGTLSSRAATASGSGKVRRKGTGALASPRSLVTNTGKRIVTGNGAIQSGRASLGGGIFTGRGDLASGEALLYGRERIIPYSPAKRLKPVRVNRYTVALKPKPRYRQRAVRKR